MSIHDDPPLPLGLNYSNYGASPSYCEHDGGQWLTNLQWCVPGANQTIQQLEMSARDHDHLYIAKESNGATRGRTNVASWKVLVAVMLLISGCLQIASASQFVGGIGPAT
ncbi:uncharacterized protein PFL1_04938 [Pseudozyma flocculosa PF-1]|uniref:Uncharacterized protein n=2 Tax=Pseudozyma flocculosa TaxID=84751 RepID=A0A5C3EWE0_9BASI|nr:uncharacterized protein PFL1_04938 [Pseudozyma flocculosa PF-1]EPQ27400.1 hypothetical protein PFL1_04938 [Pseudozyma flocculosa PF-1]SPO36180.1 uncharacterized protein PSFLO_01651 [Pseudozyma flocculosa]